MNQWERSRPRRRRQRLVLAGVFAALAFLIIVICGYLYGWKWTGLPKRTFWDWLQLLIIPAVLAGGGLWFNRQQREQELQSADRRAQDEALQTYLDQMSGMLIPPSKDLPSLYKARPGDSLSSLARARTLTVLSRLVGHRKARVVQFLYESGLIHRDRAVLDLSGADLRDTDLSGADPRDTDLRLTRANLSGVDLSGVNLIGAYLIGANLSGANLGEATLREANLIGANLSGADLSGANLGEAYLRGANLEGADLEDAHLFLVNLSEAYLIGANLSGVYLRGADLSGADLSNASMEGAFLLSAKVTREQLEEADSLEGAIMPDGQILRGDMYPNGPTFENWLKDREGHKEDGENE